MKKEIKLVNDTISNQDIDSLIEWLKTYPRLTKGPLTEEFEKEWSEWLGVKHSVFVNSGSSANLMMLYALKIAKKFRNNKVVVPALAWATDLAPVIQLGFEPILIDANKDNLSVSIKELEYVFKRDKPSVFILVSVLGLPPNMTELQKLCKKHGVYLLEDVCESLGSRHKDKKLGTFGSMSSFSTYFGHHMSTIEGGMVCTDDDELYKILKMIRSHGWDRDLNTNEKKELREKWDVDEFSSLYTFYEPGFNLRSTDLQAHIGLSQIKKLDKIIEKRNQNYCHFEKLLSSKLIWFPNIPKSDFVSSFCIPIVHKNKKEIIKRLQDENIEVRPLIAGSMGTQPFYVSRYGYDEKKHCSTLDEFGFYVPNHPGLEFKDIKRICDIILEN